MKEAEIVDSFMDFLVAEKGYPKQMLRREYESKDNDSRHYWADLVVLNPYTTGIAAVFEFKNDEKLINHSKTRELLLSMRAALRCGSIAAYLVAPSPAGVGMFVIKQVISAGKVVEILPRDFPEYKTLVLGDTASWKAEKDFEKKEAVDSFVKICWLLAFAVACLFVLDVNKWVDLKMEQLTLLGMAVGLAVAPFAARFKFLGMEWERYNPTKKD